MATIVALDIETIPDEGELAYAIQTGPETPFTAPGNYKDPDKIAEYVANARARWEEGLIKRCSLDPDYGNIASVALWDGSQGGTLTLNEFDGDETTLLLALWDHLRDIDGIVTFNGVSFDWRWIRERSCIRGVRLGKSFDTRRQAYWPNCDLMLVRADWERDRWRGLAETCRIFGVSCEGKESGMDGSQVYQYVQDGRWAEVAAYNLSDAKATWDLYQRLVDMGRIPGFESAAHRGGREAA